MIKTIFNIMMTLSLLTALSGCVDSPSGSGLADSPSAEESSVESNSAGDETPIEAKIADHTNTDITAISETDIQNAIDKLHVAYGHTSHGSQIISGMNGLVDFANGGGKGLSHTTDIFDFSSNGDEGVLHLLDCNGSAPLAGDVGYFPAWVNYTQDFIDNDAYNEYNVIMWSWCGQVSGLTEENMVSNYLQPMSDFEEANPDIVFIYMTGHLDGTGADGNLNLQNEQIREYCRENDKWLYDFADIESYDPDGFFDYLQLLANDACDYDSDGNGSRETNWASTWRNTHTENVDWYDCGAAHSDSLNANMKAYAMWWLLTEIAKVF